MTGNQPVQRRETVVRIRISYDGTTYDIGDTADNRAALKEVGQLVSDGQSENLILELVDGGTLILVIGPAIPLAVMYLDM